MRATTGNEVAADDGRGLEEPDRLGGKPRQPRTDGLPDTGRHRPLDEPGGSVHQRPAHLRDEERVAPGAGVHLLDVAAGQPTPRTEASCRRTSARERPPISRARVAGRRASPAIRASPSGSVSR